MLKRNARRHAAARSHLDEATGTSSRERGRVSSRRLTQSALGTGAGYVALLLIAYERFGSRRGRSASVLLADLVPPMLLGPVFGAAADRWSRSAAAWSWPT